MKRKLFIGCCVAGWLFSGCASLSPWGRHDRPVAKKSVSKSGTKTPSTNPPEKPAIPLETKRPEPLQYAKAGVARQTASSEVLEQGLDALQHKEYPRALQLFQEAVTIDGNNGAAYYYLAKTYFALRQPERIQGLLERADALLAGDVAWQERIAEFRRQLQGTI